MNPVTAYKDANYEKVKCILFCDMLTQLGTIYIDISARYIAPNFM
jgi:hypothetical protein